MLINGIEIETEIDKDDLPKTIVKMFKARCKYKTEINVISQFFTGNNGKTYSVGDYSLFLGMTKNSLANRIRSAGDNYKHPSILLYDKPRHTNYNPLGRGSTHNTSSKRTRLDCEKKLASMPNPTKFDDMFYPKREVKDTSVTAKSMTLYPDPPPQRQELQHSLLKLRRFNEKKRKEGVVTSMDFREEQSAHIISSIEERS